jgi:hypothetical protein
MRIFKRRSGTERSINMAGTLFSLHPACQQYPRTLRNRHSSLRQISRSVAARFAPLRERRSISSYGQSPLETYRSDLAYRMSVLPRRVDAQTFPLPIEGTGRESPLSKGVTRHLCRRSRPLQPRSLDFGGEADQRATGPPTGSDRPEPGQSTTRIGRTKAAIQHSGAILVVSCPACGSASRPSTAE